MIQNKTMFVEQAKTTSVLSPLSPLKSVGSSHETKAKSPIQAPISPVVASSPVSPRSRKSKRSVDQQQGKSKSVRWNPSVMARPFLHKNNYTPREIKNCWYTPKEY